MKIRFYKNDAKPARGLWEAVLLAAALMAVLPAMAADSDKKTSREPIRITADTLVTDNTQRTARFSGNVKATQEKTVITTDQLTIVYGSQGEQPPTDSNSKIERMEADGNVRIEFDNKVAVSNQAVYIVSERKLVLSGPGSKVISGKDEITGSKITFLRENGQVSLEGDGKSQVEAIIHSDQRGLN